MSESSEKEAAELVVCYTPNVCGTGPDYRCTNCRNRPAVAARLAERDAKLNHAEAELGALRLEAVNLERQLGMMQEELDAAQADRETEAQKLNKCSYIGPMRDCPTHGESAEIAALRARCKELEPKLAEARDIAVKVSNKFAAQYVKGLNSALSTVARFECPGDQIFDAVQLVINKATEGAPHD